MTPKFLDKTVFRFLSKQTAFCSILFGSSLFVKVLLKVFQFIKK